MNSNDFVNIDSIIAEATSVLNDMEFSNGLSKGWYVSRVRDAMDELAYETFYQKLTKDLDVDKKRLAVEMPTDAFNIKEMYLHNGVCDSSSKIVYWKRQYNNTGSGRGHTAKIKEGQSNYSTHSIHQRKELKDVVTYVMLIFKMDLLCLALTQLRLLN